MEDNLTFSRETIKIEGDRNLYNYTFREETALERLRGILESGGAEGIADFLDRNPDLDLGAALDLARKYECHEAVREIEVRRSR